MHFEDNFFTRMYIWEPIYISRNGIILIQSEYQSFSQHDESFHSHVELEQTWNSRRRRTELWSSCVIIFASLGTPLSLTSISVSKEILINTINFISVHICFSRVCTFKIDGFAFRCLDEACILASRSKLCCVECWIGNTAATCQLDY